MPPPAQQSPSDADKDNKQGKPAKWRSCTLQWTPGMRYNPKWNNTQRLWYYNTFKEKDLEGWKKWRAAALRAQLKELE